MTATTEYQADTYALPADWRQPATILHSMVRSLASGMSGLIRGQRVHLLHTRVGGTMSAYPPGTITRCDEQVWVQTGRGHLVIERIGVQGTEHAAPAWFVSNGFAPGDRFDLVNVETPLPPKEFSHAA